MPNPAVGSSEEFISVDSSGASLVDTTACHLSKAAGLPDNQAQSQRDDLSPEAISSPLRDLSLPISCPAEPGSTGEISAGPRITAFRTPWLCQTAYFQAHFISHLCFSSVERKPGECLSIFCPRRLGEAMPARLVSITGRSVMERVTGSAGATWAQAQMLVESAFSGPPL